MINLSKKHKSKLRNLIEEIIGSILVFGALAFCTSQIETVIFRFLPTSYWIELNEPITATKMNFQPGEDPTFLSNWKTNHDVAVEWKDNLYCSAPSSYLIKLKTQNWVDVKLEGNDKKAIWTYTEQEIPLWATSCKLCGSLSLYLKYDIERTIGYCASDSFNVNVGSPYKGDWIPGKAYSE